MLIDWDYGANGIWWVLSKEEMEAPAPSGRWSGTRPPQQGDQPRPWSDCLPAGLLDDLEGWNRACEAAGAGTGALRERGRELALRVQEGLGTDGWEVLYQLDGKIHRVNPPGSWPLSSWKQDLLGYSPRKPR